MAAGGKLEADVELKSPADKFWESIRDSANLFVKAFPDQYKSIEVLEGDGKAAGSIRHIIYGEGSPIVKSSKERIDAVDDVKKTVAYSVIDGDLLKYYKTFKALIAVVPKGEGSLVKWSCEFEKAKDDIPDPSIIKEFAIKNFVEVDELILKENS
ncbi:Bet_v_1 domain-containing protein [Cephalotus follicularis]|uniref:Bet_v_1 domain-containing protein n=1 Tax=Cephalotus follicularis TaxID=3775 RepID=A0A1Q3C2Q3_CEPFO|nr:Bet_v_1 domain-containing protein [Cephalotus follicularis]GAV91924.1 Bet_v_1 domain-containing protein [Cephalotus follicularis]